MSIPDWLPAAGYGVLFLGGIIAGLTLGAIGLQHAYTSFKIPDSQERWAGALVARPVNTSFTVTDNPYVPTYTVRINADGIRDEPVRDGSPPGERRVLVLGDSRTYGVGVNESQRFTERLQTRLNEECAGRYRVINAGIPTGGMLNFYLFLGIIGRHYDPDTVIVNFNQYSDITVAENERLGRILATIVPEVLPGHDSLRLGLRTWIRDGYLDNRPDYGTGIGRYGSRIATLSRSLNATPVFMTTTETTPVRAANRKRWMDANTTFVPPPRSFREEPGSMMYTDRHYTPRGHSVLAQTLYDIIGGEDCAS